MKKYVDIINILIMFSFNSFSEEIVGDKCNQNCISYELLGRSLLIKQLDYSGNTIKVQVVELGKNPKFIEKKLSKKNILQNSMGTISDGTIKTDTQTYKTATKIVVVTTISYFDANGDLVDVRTIVTRFALVDEQIPDV